MDDSESLTLKVFSDEQDSQLNADNYSKSPKKYHFIINKNKHDKKTIIDFNRTNNFYNTDFELHDNVLPHPYFGDIDKDIDILFIANNPSYAIDDDEYDTKLILKKNKFEEYADIIKNVNFFDSYNTNNLFFYNAWHWWHSRVIGNLDIPIDNSMNIAIVNLCGYHSRRFHVEHYKTFPSFNDKDFHDIIVKSKIIIFVWKRTFEIINKNEKFADIIKNKDYLWLTKGNHYGKTNTLEIILEDNETKNKYTETHESNAIKDLDKIFKTKPKE